MTNRSTDDSKPGSTLPLYSGEWIDGGAHFDGPFTAHGRVRFRFDEDLAFCEAEGPFNAEFFEGLTRLSGVIRERALKKPPRGFVVSYLKSILITPESIGAYRVFLNGPRNATFVAYVITPDVEGRAVMLPVLKGLWDESEREYRVFEQLEEATTWARAKLAGL